MTGPLSNGAELAAGELGSSSPFLDSSPSVERNRRIVARAFEDGIESWVDQSLEQVRGIEEFALLERSEVWEEVRRRTIGTRRWQAQYVAAGRLPDASAHDAELAAFAARAGISLEAVMHSYQVVGSWGWEAWLEALQATSMGERARLECQRAVGALVRGYEQVLTTSIVDGYREAESDTSPATVRLKGVRAYLDGLAADLGDIDYSLEQTHVGVICWNGDASAGLRRVALTLGAEQIIASPAEGEHGSLMWCWIGTSRDRADDVVEALLDLNLAGNARLAIGKPERGAEGFRHTHRQAGDVYSIARRTERVVTSYREVALEALGLADESAARDFVESELGPLAASDQRAGRLRMTLEAYLCAGHNASVAAARIGVHEQTVTRRLHVIAERLGTAPAERSAELQLALRLHPLLPNSLVAEQDEK